MTYRKIIRKLAGLEPDPHIIADFEKAATAAFEDQFLAVFTSYYFSFFPQCVQKNNINTCVVYQKQYN